MTEAEASSRTGVHEFLERFKERSDSLASWRVNSFTRWFGGAAGALQGFRQIDAAWQRAVAPHFNVFRVLGLERREVRTHSAFLAELLDPEGSHGQGNLFLRTFLESLPDLSGDLAGTDDWEIHTELTDAWLNGQIDIVLRSTKAQTVVAIENKIDAVDQDKQLERYQAWLDSPRNHAIPENNKMLLYLTIEGRKPPEGKHKAKRMSYKMHVRDWLRAAGSQVGATRLSDTLRQYLNIIEKL